jgi:hypothetical protein
MVNLPSWISDIVWLGLILYMLKLLHDFADWVDDHHPLETHFANQKAILRSLDRLIRVQERQLALTQGKPDPEGEELKELENQFHQHPPEFTEADLVREYGTADNYRDRLNDRERRRTRNAKSAAS